MKALIAAIALCAAGPLAAAPLSLDQLSNYLSGLGTVKTDFVQTNADGSRSTGVLYLKRPGRARFEYKPPNEALVVAGGGQVAVFDGLPKSSPEIFPLRRTPLNLILDRRVNLKQANMVSGHGVEAGMTVVLARDPKHPEYGSIKLYFDPEPVRLSSWVITSETGEKTRVDLGALEPAGNLSSFLFNISHIADEREN